MKKLLVLCLLIFTSVIVLGQETRSNNGNVFITAVSGNADIYYNSELNTITINRASKNLVIDRTDVYYSTVTKAKRVLQSWGWNEKDGVYTHPDGTIQAMVLLEIVSNYPKIVLFPTVKGREELGLETKLAD